ncbi:unnamed protein product [Cuscuta epithymum]|uniref:Uncharacterized protein n=1 Tax=Cuscuta epithymum TaxID=186058 RepID=A0AAV0FQL5_9ASTE|nr:unnamed protein product [Cuscuta epithymum]
MDPEAVISTFDSFWFNLQILKKRSNPPSSSSFENTPDSKIPQNVSASKKFSSLLAVETRSKGELLRSNTGYNSDSFSPVSVLPPESPFRTTPEVKRGNRARRTGRRKGESGWGSKSLSELEFKELTGFMDLGFEFSEEDVNSSLVEIIPGLQKLGKKEEEKEASEKNQNKSAKARPYLSEAWEVMGEEKKEKKGLMYWRIPSLSNEVVVKDSLKFWAHSVAAAVR